MCIRDSTHTRYEILGRVARVFSPSRLLGEVSTYLQYIISHDLIRLRRRVVLDLQYCFGLVCPAKHRSSRAPPDLSRPWDRAMPPPRSRPRCPHRRTRVTANFGERGAVKDVLPGMGCLIPGMAVDHKIEVPVRCSNKPLCILCLLYTSDAADE